jgi:hypothetical protein
MLITKMKRAIQNHQVAGYLGIPKESNNTRRNTVYSG